MVLQRDETKPLLNEQGILLLAQTFFLAYG
jgi:hypothetical protein